MTPVTLNTDMFLPLNSNQGTLLTYLLDTEHGKNIGLVEKLVQRLDEEQEEEWLRSVITEVMIRGGLRNEGPACRRA